MKRAFVVAMLVAANAGAEEAHWNLHLDLGPAFVLSQDLPSDASTDRGFATGGFGTRATFEVEPTERYGFEAGLEYDALSRLSGGGSVFDLVGGVRLRPWYNRSGGWLAGGGHKNVVYVSDLLSDVWIAAHVAFSEVGSAGFLYDVAAGLRLPIIAPLQGGIYVRFSQRFSSDDAGFMMLTAGIEASLGFSPVHAEPDADGDGVPDSRDRCPDTPRGTAVNEYGCPVAAEEGGPPPKCPDSDLDGVCDGEDECPDTPLGTKVDAKGCPLQADQPPADQPGTDEQQPQDQQQQQ